MQIRLLPFPIEYSGGYDQLAKVLSEWQDGEEISNRLYNGCFLLPYEPITAILDPNKIYYFDSMFKEEGKQPIPQIYGWRYWGYRAVDLIDCLVKHNMRIVEEVKTSEVKDVVIVEEDKE